MLDVCRVLKSAVAPKPGELTPLITPWGEQLDRAHPLPKHPRPTLVRDRWASLNGPWEYAFVALDSNDSERDRALTAREATEAVRTARMPHAFDGTITVPFSPEAPLSGVGRVLSPRELLWYRRSFEMPALSSHERLIVHFEAVDWTCALFVNGRLAATHQGGYLPFSLDITPFLAGDDTDIELSLCVYDPSDAGTQPRGKQRLESNGIWYTPQSGIWQSVWYEVVPDAYVASLTLDGAADGTLRIDALICDPDARLDDDSQLVVSVSDHTGTAVARGILALVRTDRTHDAWEVHGNILVERPHPWRPDDPYLYDVRAALIPKADEAPVDSASSYCGLRSVEIRRDREGIPRFFLNGEPLFLKGVLDQGYWPDGLMTAPSDAALVHDIEQLKDAGFNMLRKHIKVEVARWYYHCDRIGMLVWQDAVSGGSSYSPWYSSRKPTLFSASWDAFRDDAPRQRRALAADDEEYRTEWRETCTGMVSLLAGHPSIVTWVLFNEGWGQFDANKAAEQVHRLDPTRPIDAVSGWYDQHCGDYLSHHNYFRPLTVAQDRHALQGYAADRGCRAFVISEFGGWTQRIEGHAATASSYGYGNFATVDAWRKAVHQTLAQAEALAPRGLAGYVYTQLSDVEGELNGILTYDRRVNKLLG